MLLISGAAYRLERLRVKLFCRIESDTPSVLGMRLLGVLRQHVVLLRQVPRQGDNALQVKTRSGWRASQTCVWKEQV
jgi:anaerobic glycerol-3-phosphate dehydrogenase